MPNTIYASNKVAEELGYFYSTPNRPQRIEDPAFDFLCKAFTEYKQKFYRGSYILRNLFFPYGDWHGQISSNHFTQLDSDILDGLTKLKTFMKEDRFLVPRDFLVT